MTRITVVWALSLLLLAGCARDEWTAFVYPSRDNLEIYRTLGPYQTQFDCNANAQAYLIEQGWRGGGHECGLNCEPAPDIPTNVCEILDPDLY